MTSPRPRHLPTERACTVATKLADRLILIGAVEFDDRAEVVADIVKYASPSMDGYELAKTLDDCCCWACTLQTAETLDEWHSLYSQELKIMEREWTIANDIKPTLTAGRQVNIPNSKIGTITGVDNHNIAKYLVRVDDDIPNILRIVNFEDAIPYL